MAATQRLMAATQWLMAASARSRALAYSRPDAPPANVGDEGKRTITRLVRAHELRLVARAIRVVHEHGATANVLARHDPPVATVLRAIPIVTHHEVMAGRDEQRPPVVVRGLRRRRTEARVRERHLLLPGEQIAHFVRVPLLVLLGAESLALRDAIHMEQPVAHVKRVSR